MRAPLLVLGFVAACAPQWTEWGGETAVPLNGVMPVASAMPTTAESAAPTTGAPPPPPRPSRINVTDTRIEITEKIQFEPNKAAIKAESSSLLDEIADAIKTHPAIKKIRVEGHASSDGSAKANLKLSDERAKAVVADLLKRGVAPDVLIGKGFGSTQPIAPNNTEDGREKNRRVDFVILDPAPPKKGIPRGRQ